MQYYKASDSLDTGSMTRSRTSSISSDSQHPRVGLMSPPPPVRPSPAFISPTAASDIITSDQEFNTADFVAKDEETGASADAEVTPAALALLNGFLDNLLYNILGASKSTQLACIRATLPDVLKPRLASEVVATADEELSEYMGGAEDEETEFRGGQEPGGDFDLVHSWKLTRLRCMVYTRLGDMEEEDEDEYIASEGLGDTDATPRRFSSHVDNITPAAAIFLTSIIEHIGERALVIAGETARSRLSAKLNDGDESDGVEGRKRIAQLIVEDLDMEKLALNATLGRLWRTWRKRRRSPTLSHTLSRESMRRPRYSSIAHSRKSSIATIEEPVTPRDPVELEAQAPFDPADIPLPMSDTDVQEIEVPGYVLKGEAEVQTMQAVVAHKVRPRSLMVVPSPVMLSKSDRGPLSASAVEGKLRHSRSRSLPNAEKNHLPPREEETPEEAGEPAQSSPKSAPCSRSSSREKAQLETMYEDDDEADFVDAAETAPSTAITTVKEYEEDSPVSPETGAFRYDQDGDVSPISPVTEEFFEEPERELPASEKEKTRMSVVREEDEEEATSTPVNVTMATLRSRLEDDDTDDQSDSKDASATRNVSVQDSETIEGQGMAEKPTLTSTIQRPRRMSSKDASLSANPIIASTSDPNMHTLPELQGGEPVPPAVDVEAVNSSRTIETIDDDRDQDIHVVASTAVVAPARDGPSDIASEPTATPATPATPHTPGTPGTRPLSTSGDSENSHQRSKPNRLSVSNSSARNSPTAERAYVQRMPRSAASASISSTTQSKARRSESFSSSRGGTRPITSTSSNTSQKLKGLMGRSGPGESPSLRLRSSSETSRASGSGESVENDLDLDKLINSDETIHFTLTPRSVREMNFPDLPRQIPRSDTADTSDLAEFLKNTGPPGEETPASTSISSRGEQGKPDSPKHIPISSISSRMPAPPVPSKPVAAGPQPPAPRAKASTSSMASARSNPNRPKLQARAAATAGSATSDLIDFIREGPPQPDSHRIPRNVAPFRNTIDSEDLQYGAAQTNRDYAPRSINSTQSSSTPNKSVTSVGSRTGLLDSSNRPSGQTKAPASVGLGLSEDAGPTRKQRRVRDPYAIDDDDDDELYDELMRNEKPQRQEESLIDFLRSEPPPDFDSTPKPIMVPPPVPSSKTSGFGGRRVSDAVRGPTSKMSLASLRSTNSNKPPQTSYSAKVGMERGPGPAPARQTDTGALADFLRNTGPPDTAPTRSMSTMSPKVKEGGLSRFFFSPQEGRGLKR
ncbi:hypothetical protein N7468_010123 [Penicillium chermesinum]|uniref:Flo11 n=1 Tax=Penicillium chermesinum TaxID=63820 RepID=A0A9W9TD16_9EURO|nr:uncharacterized protein N7468_010123 [Penicillium chermesinum]KAJ5217115.1 hypothetical protein N7468_010123 [Penicillium chermesinum]